MYSADAIAGLRAGASNRESAGAVRYARFKSGLSHDPYARRVDAYATARKLPAISSHI